MNEYYKSEYGSIYQGSCLDILKELPEQSVNCCVTSPPYWGLRDYGTAKWEDGDSECDHLGKPMPMRAGFNERYFGRESTDNNKQDALREPYRDICGKCGAKRIDNQLGLEETPEQYTEKIVEVFKAVKRVLRDDGTLWLNLGDSYVGGGRGAYCDDGSKQATSRGSLSDASKSKSFQKVTGLKPKDLVGIPWRVAFALQADGWYLRQDIIWHKPNPMPESVTDRCTKAHEYIFLLSKSKKYYYDADAISEKTHTRDDGNRDRDNTRLNNTPGRARMAGLKTNDYETRNKRSVWTVNTKPYKEAHFAVYPMELITPCILAGCPEGGTVLDCFSGSGTTAVVAGMNKRKFVGIELNSEYCDISVTRIEQYRTGLTKAEIEAGTQTFF